MDEIHERIAKVEERCKSNTHRLDELAKNQAAVNDLALSVKKLATEQGNMKDDLDEVKTDIKSLLLKPGKRMDGLMDKSLWLLLGGALSYILSHLGL